MSPRYTSHSASVKLLKYLDSFSDLRNLIRIINIYYQVFVSFTKLDNVHISKFKRRLDFSVFLIFRAVQSVEGEEK